MKRAIAILTMTGAVLACEPTVVDLTSDEIAAEWHAEYGKPVLGVVDAEGKADTVLGVKGPLAPTDPAFSVWEIRNAWHETDTDEARRAGMAWSGDSGLTWDEKYAAWVASMERHEVNEWRTTFVLSTPWGKTLPAPALECAESTVFLRVAFASWYGLPFYLSAREGHRVIHFGHFGVYRGDTPDERFGRYAERYDDFSDMPAEDALIVWPSDPKLAKRKLTPSGDDHNEFLGENAYAGAYFDQMLLNKRVGHFLMVVLTYTGSMHLASHWNTFNLEAKAIRPGDTLLQRWQRQGIGHTLVVKEVDEVPGFDANLSVEVMSGSMPRRQPLWVTPQLSKGYFTAAKSGGPGETADGPYAALGGGLKRWRTATIQNGRWRNVVPKADEGVWIDHSDLHAIADRVPQFEELLGIPTPEEQLQGVLATIQSKRDHLREFPASCSARIGREEAFDQLYALTAEHFEMSREETDHQYRALEDYVFAELEYDSSRTCCWNSTNAVMYDVIMDLAERAVHDETAGSCNPPPVFMMENGGYDKWALHAVHMELDDQWVEWSADETCPQAETVETDTRIDADVTPFCAE